jgi:hypothetical protein
MHTDMWNCRNVDIRCWNHHVPCEESLSVMLCSLQSPSFSSYGTKFLHSHDVHFTFLWALHWCLFSCCFHFRRSTSLIWFVRHRLCTLSVWPRARTFPRPLISPRNKLIPLLPLPLQHTAPAPLALTPPPSGNAHRHSSVSRRYPHRLWWTRWQTDFILFGVNFS